MELLFYISLFAVFSLAAINALITMTRAFKETAVQGELMRGGVIMERNSREIRGAYNISALAAGDLKLDTQEDGENKTVEFLLSGTDLQFWENGNLTGNLNSPNISVQSLVFAEIADAKGQAVRVTLGVSADNDPEGRSADYYNTVILRGSY